jgi:hypothetical protein
MGEKAMIEICVLGAFATAALWDVARRHAGARERANLLISQAASDAALNLDKRIRDLEAGQREIVARIGGQPVMSRFQRKA